MGDDHFAERALSASGYGGMIKPPSLHHIIEAVCNEYGIEKAVLHEQGKGRLHSEARAMAAFIVQGLEGVTLTSLAEEMNRELSGISQSAGRLHKRMNQNELLRKKSEKIATAINIPNCQESDPKYDPKYLRDDACEVTLLIHEANGEYFPMKTWLFSAIAVLSNRY